MLLLAAYAKFLRGETLVEIMAQGFSPSAFQDKMHKIQATLPDWVQKTGQKEQAMSLVHNMQSLVKERKWQEADKAADEVLALIAPPESK